MSLQTCSLIMCVFLAQMAAGTGVQFVMERHPENYFCGHLQCLADFIHTDHDVFSLVEMTIYDITRVNSELRLASVSTFDPDLYVDTTKSSSMGCTGTISRLKANLTLQLRHDIDCLYGVYKCQLDLVTVSGHSEVLTEIVTPEYNHSYSRIAEVLSHFDRLTELLNNITIIMNSQTAQINRSASQSDDQSAQLVNQTAQLHRITSQLDYQAAQISRFKNQSDYQTAHIHRLANLSDDQTSQLVEQTAQLVEQTAHLHNISQRCGVDQVDQKQRREMTDNRLKLLQEKLDNVEKRLNLSIEPVPDLMACRRGQLRENRREKIVLWGNITALCDTTTDGGGWVIIQRRVRGDVNFYRGWDDYKKGFGNLDTDFWIGNDIIHNLTSQGYNELRIDFVYNETNYFAQYTDFSVADESSNYRITISGFSGNFHDTIKDHNGSTFGTLDTDNDLRGLSCSVVFHGSWWYHSCHETNLNGARGKIRITDNSGHFGSVNYRRPLTFTEMKIR